MKSLEFNQNYKRVRSSKDYEEPFGDSLTVPDQGAKVRDVLERYAHGIVPGQKEPMYSDAEDFDETVFDKPDRDLTDIDQAEELIKESSKRIRTARQMAVERFEANKGKDKLSADDAEVKPKNQAKPDVTSGAETSPKGA